MATLTAPERKPLIAKLRNLPNEMQAAVKGLTPEQLETPYREGGWTVAQVVHHVADSHMNAYLRMKFMLTEDKPALKGYSQDVWAARDDARAKAVAPSITLLKGLHKRWIAMLKKIGRAEWKRTGMHSERGEVTLDDLLIIYANHGEKHVGQILALRKTKGW
ncbi:MAG: YfiT family bacillithiol transferase [Acidobacteriota bacterium]